MITAFFVFVIGACVGSFCSALLHRTRYGGSMVTGRSECVACKQRLGPTDLVPIVSWHVRRGRCRYCRAPVSWQYLALELVFGGLFLAAYLRSCCYGPACYDLGCWWAVGRLFIFLTLLALIFVYDARHGEIPDAYSITAIVAGLLINILITPSAWWWYLLAAAVGAAFFGAQYAVSRGKWVGDGDILVGAALGAMLGWPDVLTAIFGAYIIGLGVVIVLMLARKKDLNDTIPLGPLLTLAAALLLLLPAGFIPNIWYALSF